APDGDKFSRQISNKGPMQSDAIVSTTSTYLDLSNGSTNIDISRADGRELRNEYKVFYPEGIEKGIIAFCQTHRLKKEKVKFILLGVLDKYIFQSFEANVKTFVKSCLFLAEELECRSVSFPAIGVETLKYPRRETIAFVLDAIDAYKLEVKHSDITKVNIVCAEKDRKTIDAFNAAEERRRPDSCMASPEKGQRSFKDSTISWHLSLNEAASESLEMIGRTPECALEATKEVLQLIAETKNSQKSSKSQTDMGSQKDTDAFQDYEKKNKIKTNGSPSVMSESTPGRQKQGSVRDKKFLKGDGQQTEPLGSSSSTGFSGIEATNKAPENTGKNENNTEGDNPHTIAPQKEKPIKLFKPEDKRMQAMHTYVHQASVLGHQVIRMMIQQISQTLDKAQGQMQSLRLPFICIPRSPSKP
ncbi:hypothetical protein MAR_015227, partial [Mya arenaria]